MTHPRQGIKDLPYICAQLGMKHVVITPGSRNAPLIISFNQEKRINCLSITDERSAGYFAMGIAQATGTPVGLACTSGTAALNFGPAIAEAFYQNLPLIIFTADRPPELIDQADGQTIRQTNIFANHVKKSFTLPVESSPEVNLSFNNRILSEAIGTALQQPQGPVHINVPLREPLYGALPQISEKLKTIKNADVVNHLSEPAKNEILNKWKKYKKKLVIAGFGQPDAALQKVLSEIARDPSVVVIAENLSNLSDRHFVCSPESFFASLNENEKPEFAPDLLITTANSVVSKRLKQFLRANKPAEHWHVAPQIAYTDTYQSLSMNIPVTPESFFKMIVSSDSPDDKQESFHLRYVSKVEDVKARHHQYLATAPFSDLKAFEIILGTLPPETVLHLANSTPVRYAQLFSSRADITYFSNRGTSGIDGCVSTAAGYAYASDKPVVVITGDLAFIYDSSAMWNNYLPEQFRIIVMNNGGGNIFRLIETGPEMNALKDFFETPHNVNLKQLSSAFGLRHQFCHDIASLQKELDILLSTKGPSVLEIKTDGNTDADIFKQYYSYLKK
ncbi:MAG: 2-succinyl-5-enolpyruvyl-6-hydroxy-3-cyclohexene-1-carboxylic-acid synthase [Bacteroidales bacterium]|nr:2-succinyl-5-enolpyruvyl-6-hydroxy-3-cyclohexene-1-carboxylic-acid synthase [Bacteroidales bacterium]